LRIFLLALGVGDRKVAPILRSVFSVGNFDSPSALQYLEQSGGAMARKMIRDEHRGLGAHKSTAALKSGLSMLLSLRRKMQPMDR
jgi:hypothetical protein